jgi:hypothetical protein
MAVHGPDYTSVAKLTLADGTKLSLVKDRGQPQGCPYPGEWWRLERYLPPASEIIAALEASLPAPTASITIKSFARAESAWYPAIDLALAISAARAGTLDQFWAGKPSASWWAALPVGVRAGFAALLADCRP